MDNLKMKVFKLGVTASSLLVLVEALGAGRKW
jgi:hypothetical protein